jgi:hypothetical protein
MALLLEVDGPAGARVVLADGLPLVLPFPAAAVFLSVFPFVGLGGLVCVDPAAIDGVLVVPEPAVELPSDPFSFGSVFPDVGMFVPDDGEELDLGLSVESPALDELLPEVLVLVLLDPVLDPVAGDKVFVVPGGEPPVALPPFEVPPTPVAFVPSPVGEAPPPVELVLPSPVPEAPTPVPAAEPALPPPVVGGALGSP